MTSWERHWHLADDKFWIDFENRKPENKNNFPECVRQGKPSREMKMSQKNEISRGEENIYLMPLIL